MKKWILLGCILILVAGCSNNVTLWERETSDLKEMAKEDVLTTEYVLVENIDEALDYLKEHIIEPLKNRETGKRMIYYSSYLEELGNKSNIAKDMEITKIGKQIQEYVSSLYVMEELPNSFYMRTKGLNYYLELITIDDKMVQDFVALFE